MPAFWVKLNTIDLNCVDVPLNPTHSLRWGRMRSGQVMWGQVRSGQWYLTVEIIDMINTLSPFLSVLRQSSSFINPQITAVTDVLYPSSSWSALSLFSWHTYYYDAFFQIVISEHMTVSLTFLPSYSVVALESVVIPMLLNVLVFDLFRPMKLWEVYSTAVIIFICPAGAGNATYHTWWPSVCRRWASCLEYPPRLRHRLFVIAHFQTVSQDLSIQSVILST